MSFLLLLGPYCKLISLAAYGGTHAVFSCYCVTRPGAGRGSFRNRPRALRRPVAGCCLAPSIPESVPGPRHSSGGLASCHSLAHSESRQLPVPVCNALIGP